MDIAFKGIINKSMVVYLNDITVYSKKNIFAIEEGTFLGFLISPDGITIDPGKIKVIKSIAPPHNKKEMPSFLGKINFVRRFISNFVEIVKPLQGMIMKDANFKWTKERKEAIAEVPTLWRPNFEREFILYTFFYNHPITTVLTQKYEAGEEFLVSFMRTGLQGVELNYPTINKQDFVVFKEVKHLRLYLLSSHTKMIVRHSVVRYLLIQKETGDRQGNWLTSLQEYDLEIKPTKLVKGQGLCKLVVEALDLQESEEGWENEVDMFEREVIYIPTSTNSRYNDLKYYLTYGSSIGHLDARKR